MQIVRDQVAHAVMAVVDDDLVSPTIDRTLDGCIDLRCHSPLSSRVPITRNWLTSIRLLRRRDIDPRANPAGAFHVGRDQDYQWILVSRHLISGSRITNE